MLLDLFVQVEGLTALRIPALFGSVSAVVMSACSGLVAVAGGSAKANKIVIIDSVSGEIMGSCDGHTGTINNVVFTSDGLHIVSCSIDKTVRIWAHKNKLSMMTPAQWPLQPPTGVANASQNDSGALPSPVVINADSQAGGGACDGPATTTGPNHGDECGESDYRCMHVLEYQEMAIW